MVLVMGGRRITVLSYGRLRRRVGKRGIETITKGKRCLGYVHHVIPRICMNRKKVPGFRYRSPSAVGLAYGAKTRQKRRSCGSTTSVTTIRWWGGRVRTRDVRGKIDSNVVYTMVRDFSGLGVRTLEERKASMGAGSGRLQFHPEVG